MNRYLQEIAVMVSVVAGNWTVLPAERGVLGIVTLLPEIVPVAPVGLQVFVDIEKTSREHVVFVPNPALSVSTI